MNLDTYFLKLSAIFFSFSIISLALFVCNKEITAKTLNLKQINHAIYCIYFNEDFFLKEDQLMFYKLVIKKLPK
jgi:hypothetical protein